MKDPMPSGGDDRTDQGTDQSVPANQQEWLPESALACGDSLPELPESVVQEIIGMVKPYFPHVDVRLSQDKKRVGVWTTRSPNANSSAARDRGLAKLALKPKFDLVFSMSPSIILGMGDVIWKKLPKKYNQWGNEAAGPDDIAVVLERFDLSLVGPNKIRLHLHGVAPGAIAGIVSPGFDYVQTDTLTIDEKMHIHSKKHESIDTDPGILKVLNTIWEGIKSSWAGPGGSIAGALGAGVGAGFSGPNPGSILANQLPKQILIPGKSSKLLLQYNSVHVSPNSGILIEIASPVRNRVPSVSLGTSHVSVPYEATAARAEVSFTAKDFREPKAHWETDGEIKTHGHTALITYHIPQPHPLHMTHTVRVKLTDHDGGSASAHLDVTIDTKPDPDGPPHGPPHQPHEL
jgi:hypothetical protein